MKMKRGWPTILERAKWPERSGYRWACLFCTKRLQKVCGEPWDGFVMKNRML